MLNIRKWWEKVNFMMSYFWTQFRLKPFMVLSCYIGGTNTFQILDQSITKNYQMVDPPFGRGIWGSGQSRPQTTSGLSQSRPPPQSSGS